MNYQHDSRRGSRLNLRRMHTEGKKKQRIPPGDAEDKNIVENRESRRSVEAATDPARACLKNRLRNRARGARRSVGRKSVGGSGME